MKSSISSKSGGGPKKPSSSISSKRPSSPVVSKRPSTPSRPFTPSTPKSPPNSGIKSSISSQGPSKYSPAQPGGPAKAPVAKTGGLSPEHQAKLDAARNQWSSISTQISLPQVHAKLEKTANTVSNLDNKIAALRARGYKFGQSWEARAQTLQEQWPQQQQTALDLLQQQQSGLQISAREIEGYFGQAAVNAAVLMALDAGLNSFQGRLNAAESQVGGVFGSTAREADLLEAELDQASFLLDSLDSASFQLYPDETGVAVCHAKWVSDREEPTGLLFLTTARVLFEQREEKVTKKVLFIATEKQLVQELLWHAPVGAVEDMNAEDISRFMARNKELLTLRFNIRTREIPNDVQLDLLDADNHTWIGLIRRVKEGRVDAEVVETQDGAVLPEPKSIPTKCPSCGAQLPEVFRGMRTVACDYCGTIVPIEY